MSDRGLPDARKLEVGDRVRVDDRRFPDYWANGAVGTVSHPARGGKLAGWSGHVHVVRTIRGLEPYYFVELDEPIRDGDGDGPYKAAEIAGSALHALSSADED